MILTQVTGRISSPSTSIMASVTFSISSCFFSGLKTSLMTWMGERSYRDAMVAGDLLVEGDPALTRRISSWLRPSVFVDSKRAPVPALLASAG